MELVTALSSDPGFQQEAGKEGAAQGWGSRLHPVPPDHPALHPGVRAPASPGPPNTKARGTCQHPRCGPFSQTGVKGKVSGGHVTWEDGAQGLWPLLAQGKVGLHALGGTAPEHSQAVGAGSNAP